MTGISLASSARPRRAPVPDLLGVLWVLAAAGAVLTPALSHGAYLGSFDWVSRFGLSRDPSVVVHNRQAFDQITEFIPWTSLAWTQVHHGQLPLWNSYSALGMPLAFNWQSATFSLPSVVGYLFPLHLAYTVQVVTTLVVAGTGAYVFTRLLGVGVLGCAMAGTVFELSGSFFGWLGWPMASVLSWAGWLFAAALLVVRGRRRARAIAFFAVVVALAIYAGQPDALALLAVSLGVFVVALLALRTPDLGGSGPIRRPALDLAVATVAGVALGAPLLLPGAQLLGGSLRGVKGGSQALPPRDLMYVFFQGFDGSPAGTWFGPSFYVRTAAYVGVIAVVLAVLAVVTALGSRSRRPDILALGVVAVVSAVLVVVPPLVLGSVQWHRALLPMDFALAVLAGAGTEVLVRAHAERVTRSWTAALVGGIGLIVAAIFVFGRGALPAAHSAARARSFIWPSVQVVIGMAVVAGLQLAGRRTWPGRHSPTATGARLHSRSLGAGWWAGAGLLLCETAFLVASGASIQSSSPHYLTPTPAEAALRRTVGASLVGFGTTTCFTVDQLGTVPEVNDALGFREFALYDPLLPRAYDTSWLTQSALQPLARPGNAIVPFSTFCPAVTDVRIARLYGIGFVLEPAGTPAPKGFVAVRTLAGEDLYRIPGAAPATLVPASTGGELPALDAPGRPVTVDHPDPATWHMVTASARSGVLRMRLTDVPGWHATIDGRAVDLERFAQVMLQMRVPPGHHVVELTYRPAAFDDGIVLAGASAVGLVGVPLALRLRRRTVSRRLTAPT